MILSTRGTCGLICILNYFEKESKESILQKRLLLDAACCIYHQAWRQLSTFSLEISKCTVTFRVKFLSVFFTYFDGIRSGYKYNTVINKSNKKHNLELCHQLQIKSTNGASEFCSKGNRIVNTLRIWQHVGMLGSSQGGSMDRLDHGAIRWCL